MYSYQREKTLFKVIVVTRLPTVVEEHPPYGGPTGKGLRGKLVVGDNMVQLIE